MSKENDIIEGNRLISEFEGYKFKLDFQEPKSESNGYFIDGYFTPEEHLEYHTSWDWQIPVWSKIASAVKKEVIKNGDTPYYWKRLNDYEAAIFGNNPQKGFEIILDMLKWLNNEKSKPIGSNGGDNKK